LLSTAQVDLDQLISAVARRDKAAFRKLYDVSAPKLFATVLRILKHKPIAEEVLQDAFLRIWQNAPSFSPQAAPAQVWMNAIARNRAIDVLRQRSLPTVTPGGDDADVFERIAEDRDREADMIDKAALRHCLGQIDKAARDCVLLAYYEGFSREELSTRFGRPVNTIKTWLHRSLTALRTCLDGLAA
jgi:RNA polymerase sigma-70 factor (ECF subfamily)